MLAAQYFAPLLRATPFPSSMREAWESIDNSILFFVYGHVDGLTELERATYRFAGNEPEPSANSTLSDWQRKGIQQLAELIISERQRLSASQPAPVAVRRNWMKPAGLAFGSIILLLAAWLGWNVWHLVRHAQALEIQANELGSYLSPQPELKKLPEIAQKVHILRLDLDAFQAEAAAYLWLAPYSGWLPEIGGTTSQAGQLLALAQNLTAAADQGLTAVTPVIETALSNDKPLEVMDMLLKLKSSSPQLLNAQLSLAQALDARKQIDSQRLIPKIKNMLTNRLDPLLTSFSGSFPMEDALSMVQIAPTLLGGGSAGPQTYLILIQNEDEMRPTGGFLTAAGSAVVMNGKLISMKIESAELIDDFTKPYPISPWQFKLFMNIDMLLFRDSNWFTNFPTTASWAEYFYSYSRATSADGVIAIDSHVIVRLLKTLGPIQMENIDYPITSENVLEYMRSAKEQRPKDYTGKVWDRKQFIGKLAQPLLEKILNARGQTWSQLMPVLLELLDEKHLLLQFDDEQATNLLQRRNWDGAVRVPEKSDFLMVVNSNMGYNKTYAVMETTLNYTADLSVLTGPVTKLIIQQTNHSQVEIPCKSKFTTRFLRPVFQSDEIIDPFYPIDECFWGYLRIYTPEGAQLLSSNPQQIPAEATMLQEVIPARTDDLGSEEISNAQVFGCMVLTPTHSTTSTEFEAALPPGVLTKDESRGAWVYRLKVQKQPGTLAQPFSFSVKLPGAARIESASIPLTENAGAWTAQLDLRRDILIEISFRTD